MNEDIQTLDMRDYFRRIANERHLARQEKIKWASYHIARAEHAWLLRIEGLTYVEIGNRLGVSYQCAMDKVMRFSSIVQSAIIDCRWCLCGCTSQIRD